MDTILYNTGLITTIFYMSVALISIVMYNKSNANYNTNRVKIHSIKSFVFLYKYIQISTLLICLLCLWFDHPYLFKMYTNTDFLIYLGIAVSGLGITLFSLSRFSLGKNYSPCYDSYMPKDIKTSGIYSIVRHPIYSSNILLMVGIFISTGSIIIAINTLILATYYFISAFIEEKAISNKFPKYKKYKKETGMFVPHLIKR